MIAAEFGADRQWTQTHREKNAMANREQRGNREKRKPKKEKPKQSVQASPFARTQEVAGAKSNAGNKRR
jgi:hypothetical protein